MFVSVTDCFDVLPSLTLPKLTVVGFAESVPVPESPPDPEPPEPEPDEPVAPLLTTPAQLDSPIETTTRTSVANSVKSARIAGCLRFSVSNEDNVKGRRSPRVLIIGPVYGPLQGPATGRGNKQRTGEGDSGVQGETALTCTSSRPCLCAEIRRCPLPSH